ncbi:Protein of unknown function, DUF488 [Actinopolymorpha cephalotaxi]|uniref:Uncharacterized protein (DUF488 family) n=1 Tax=Actinopolymorpha cephalotaxi TaxID=504797 RepID=A0A1I2VDR7_9ACTN|nr:DUF488 domain-containing protein [Actinopolymorpha cephalotaxi]NYH84841.1 uncharacterized protein (DUF488 family) [Actinopolymorpha cephalotaxi]SFG87213.1 Protein of unknown function, DUF488 [Actinopolymorpha cephalotaxi]
MTPTSPPTPPTTTSTPAPATIPALSVTTFGHGTASAEATVELLRGAGISMVVDVRTAPGSRRNPQFSRAELERHLPELGIGYRWDRRLGGFRKVAADSPDSAWRNDAFRGYAGHMRTPEFLAGIDDLLAGLQDAPAGDEDSFGPTAIMCSESLWWRCHRRMIADFLHLVRGVRVRHLFPDGSVAPHQLGPGVRVRSDGLLVYDGGQASVFDDPE